MEEKDAVRSSGLVVHREYDLVSENEDGRRIRESVLVVSFCVSEGWFDAKSLEDDKVRRYSMAEEGVEPDLNVDWKCQDNGKYVVARY